MSRGIGLRTPTSLPTIVSRASHCESLETRCLLSGVASTVVAGSNLYTAVDNTAANAGSDLYVSDLDGGNQRLLHHWNNNYETPKHLLAYGQKLLFAGSLSDNPVDSYEPWVSDGTAAGTVNLKNIYEASRGSNPSAFHLVNGRALFTARHNSDQNYQLYSTDGTPQGTIELSPDSIGTNGYGQVGNVVYGDTTATFTVDNYRLEGDVPFTTNGLTASIVTEPVNSIGVIGSKVSNDRVPHNVALHGDNAGHLFLVIDGKLTAYTADDVQRVYLYGGFGDDQIFADVNVHKFVYIAGFGGNDSITGGGDNILDLSTSWSIRQIDQPIKLTLSDSGGTARYGNGPVTTLHGVFKSIYLGRGNDTVTGSTGGEYIRGLEGNDYIVGQGGGDTIDGGPGADTIVSHDSRDSIVADADDTILAEEPSGGDSTPTTPAPVLHASLNGGVLRVFGTDADDLITLVQNGKYLIAAVNNLSKAFATAEVSTAVIYGGDGADRITLGHTTILTKLYGEAGNDTLEGSLGKDRLYGGAGNDWISGGDNHDTLYGEAGDDRLFGGNGHDYLVGGGGANLLRGEGSVDHLVYHAADDILGNRGDKLTLASIVG